MKVVQVVADGTPGGGTTNVLALCEDLSATGVDVRLISQAGSYALQHADGMGIGIVDGLNFFHSRNDRRIVNQLREAVYAVRPDLVHVHGGRAAWAWIRGASERELSRTIYTVRGYHFYRKPWPIRSLAKAAERRISDRVWRTVHVCQDDRETAFREKLLRDGSRGVVIRNGIRLSDIPQVETGASRHDVAVLGRLSVQKNPHLVVDLAKRMANDGFRFHWIGGGDMEPEIRSRLNDEKVSNFILHGAHARPQALQLMARCGTFLLASRWEGLPIAPVEAMQMGLAVVVSDVNGNREVVRDGEDGWVVAAESIDGYGRALQSIVESPTQTERMIRQSADRVVRHFTRDRVLAQHVDLYRCATDQGQRRAA